MKKGDKLREGLNRLVSEREDPAKIERVLNKLTGQGSIPDRLWVLWTRVKGLTEEAEDLSTDLEFHSGSRLSQVIDHLKQAETLISETMSLTTGQTPSSDEFEIRDRGHNWEVWDKSKGLGIGFRKWDGQTPSYLMYIQEGGELTGDDFDDDTMRRLVEFARGKFPREFENMNPDPRL